MNIVLKKADFSANNLGITMVIRNSEVTADAFLATLSSQPSQSIVYSFRDFVFKLKNAGIWDKIKLLMIPAICDNTVDALKDVMGGDSFAGQTGYIPSDLCSFIHHSIKYNGGAAEVNKTVRQLDLANFHMVMWSNNGGVTDNTTDILNWRGTYSQSILKGKAQTVYNWPNPIVLDVSVWNGFFGVSNKSNYVTAIANDLHGSAINSGSFPSTGGDINLSDFSELEEYSIISWGDGLTESEMVYYKDCAKLMMSVINSNN